MRSSETAGTSPMMRAASGWMYEPKAPASSTSCRSSGPTPITFISTLIPDAIDPFAKLKLPHVLLTEQDRPASRLLTGRQDEGAHAVPLTSRDESDSGTEPRTSSRIACVRSGP